MMGHLKLGGAAFAALILAACSTTDPKYYVDTDADADQYAATNNDVELPDEMQWGIEDDDDFEAVTTTTTTTVLPRTAVASRVIRTDTTIYGAAPTLTNYSTVYGAIETAGLGPVFDGDDDYTVFAPSNAAFAGYDLSMATEAELQQILKGHVVEGRISSADLSKKLDMNNGVYMATTLSGDEIRFMRDGDMIKVADANGYTYTIDAADNEFENGYVHGINGVLGRTY